MFCNSVCSVISLHPARRLCVHDPSKSPKRALVSWGKKGLVIVWLAVCAAAAEPSFSSISKAGYLEPGDCAACHREIAESYARTGMARTFGTVRSENEFPELKAGTFHHRASEEYFSVFAKDGKPILKRHQIGFDGEVTNVLETQINYWFGSGNHARSYIRRTKSGELVELPITWYAENGGYWAMSPAYDRPDHAGFNRKITHRCMFCHNAYPQIKLSAEDWDASTRFPDRLPEGIDCQRCHGPGQA